MAHPEFHFEMVLPPVNRQEPRLWVKELAVYREWKPDAEQQRISLRQGLNIIWAEPSKQGAGGHAAGKTTFCRFLRYLLGDSNFGSDAFREAFRIKFPNAWLAGEVYLDGEPWLIARFIGITGSPHWSARGVTFDRIFDEQIERQTHADFVRALQKAFIQPLPIDSFPGSGKQVEWTHLLAWLSRDQEARYDHVLDWRSTYSGSPVLGDIHSADRTLLVRTVLGLMHEKELDARKEHMEILRQKAECEGLIPKLVFARDRAAKEYLRLMQVSDETIIESALAAAETSLKQDETRLAARVRDFQQQDGVGEVLTTQRDDLVTRLAGFTEKLRNLEADQNRVKLDLALREGRISEEDYRKQLAQMPLRADQCSAPLELAEAYGCKLAQSLHPNRFSEHLLAELKSTQGALQEKKTSLEQEGIRLAREQRDANKDKAEVERRIIAARRRHQDIIQGFDNDLGLIRRKLAVTNELQSLTEELEAERKKLERLQTEQRKSTEYQDTLRQQATTRQSEFSEIFSALAKRVLLSNNRGAVRFLAEDVKLDLDYNDLTSTALITLKILLFDLAGLFASARGSESHPGFLIHDSPREADLTATIYRRLFEIAHTAENSDGTAPIQYIITTTEPPPEILKREPWLVHPPFSSAEKERRFLRENL